MIRHRYLGAASVLAAATFIAAGCGGGGQNRSGRASIAIEWPEPGRLIPKASNFVRVRAFTATNDAVGTLPPSVGRPAPPASNTSTITIDNLPVGANITFRAEAFAQNPDSVAGQVPQASGQQTIPIRNDAPNTFDISMASTVTAITFEKGGAPIAGTLNLLAGEDAAITAQARNNGGALVLVDPTNWNWTSGNANLQVNSSNTASGPNVTARGSATITAALNVMESEANIPGALNIQVAQPTYPGAVDGAIAGDATGFGDVASGPMMTKAPGDRAFALLTRRDPSSGASRREVDIHDANDAFGMPIMGNFVPTFAGPNPNHVVRNSTGLAHSYDPGSGEAVVVNFNDGGGIVWVSEALDFINMVDVTARKGFTYALQDGPGVGFRVTKLKDSDGTIVKQLLAPRGFTPSRITVDDQENFYFGLGDALPWVIKMDKNGDQQPFSISPVTFNDVLDLDFDQGLIFVMEEGSPTGPVAIVRVFGQMGSLVQTIQVPRKFSEEFPRRMSVFNGQVFVVTDDGNGTFTIRQVER